MVRAIYIMGSGRSGSTLLDRLLGMHPGIFSCGELSGLGRALRSQNEHCACGAAAADCPFWQAVLKRWRARVDNHDIGEYEQLRAHMERPNSLLRPFRSRSLTELQIARYQTYMQRLFDAIAHESGAWVVIDSSKGPRRAAALAQLPGLQLTLIHLVRDPRGVALSYSKPLFKDAKTGVQRDMPGRDVARTSIDWVRTNLSANRVRRSAPDLSMLLRYEDLVSEPISRVGQIGGLAGLKLGDAIENVLSGIRTEVATHMIAGNRMRMEKTLELRPESAALNGLDLPRQVIVSLLTLPLLFAYDYPLKVSHDNSSAHGVRA